MARLYYQEETRRLARRTYVVIATLLLLLFAVIFGAGLVLGAPPIFTGIVAVVLTFVYLATTLSRGVSTVIRAANARPANPDSREEKLLMQRVEEMAIAAQLPAPKVYVQDSDDPNAFAAGMKPQESIVCVTRGGLRLWNQQQLEGVIAHEMSHILNRDVRLATMTIAVVGAIAMIGEIVVRMLFFGGRGRDRGGHPILIVVGLVFLVLAPLLSRLTYLAMSRNREYLADATAVRLTRNPEGLADALDVVRKDQPDHPVGSRTVASLYFANPWSRRHSVWSTHPPLEERISRLRAMAGAPG